MSSRLASCLVWQEPVKALDWPAVWYGKNRLRRGGVPHWLNRILSDGVNSIASPEDQDNVEGQDNIEDQDNQDNVEDQDNVEAQETTADQQESTADISTGRRYNLRRHIRAPDPVRDVHLFRRG